MPVVGVAHDVFAVKSRRGQIVRIIREHYIRDDIKTGLETSRNAKSTPKTQTSSGPGLHDDATHFAIPDANTLLRFLEVFETARDWKDVVILQTVWDRFNSLAASRARARLRRLIDDSSRRFVIFDNEHHSETYLPRLSREPTTSRDLRAVAKAAEFLARLLTANMDSKRRPVVVIWEAVRDHPLTKTERIKGVFYESMANYITKWQVHSPQVWRCYQEVLEVEESDRKRAELAKKEILTLTESSSVISNEGKELKTALSLVVGASTRAQALRDREAAAYAPHSTIERLETLRKKGEAFAGKLQVSRFNPQNEATIQLKQRDRQRLARRLGREVISGEVWVFGFEARNRAIDGDEVYIRLLPQNMWAPSTASSFLLKDIADADRPTLAKINTGTTEEPGGKYPPSGVVVGILKRNWRDFVCTLQVDERTKDFRSVIGVPLDRRLPRVRIQTGQAPTLIKQRLLCRLRGWPPESKIPNAYYVKSLGPIGDPETETQAICVERGVFHPPFPPFLLKGLPEREGNSTGEKKKLKSGMRRLSRERYGWQVPDGEAKQRRDLRESHAGSIFSIDPLGCEDVDDALSARPLPDGGWEVGVHIADVTHFVPEGSPLDVEARERGTSVYLVDRRLDMLPSVLSADLCSLRGGTDRLAVSVLWTLAPKAKKGSKKAGKKHTDRGKKGLEVRDVWFGRTVIHNSAALSYQQAQEIVDNSIGELEKRGILHEIDGDPDLDLKIVKERLTVLRDCARRLILARKNAGALNLQSFVPEFDLEETPSPEQGAVSKRPTRVKAEAHDLEMHHTIAEFMIFANCEVASKIFQAPTISSNALLRHHPFPDQTKFHSLQTLAKNKSLTIQADSNKALQRSLDRAEARLKSSMSSSADTNWSSQILRAMATKAMSEAQYVAAGDFEKKDGRGGLYHYGLAADLYTHFTSPIRRYADIIVHRQLLRAVASRQNEAEECAKDNEGERLDLGRVRKMAKVCNVRNRNAKMAARDSQDLFLHIFLMAHGPVTTQAIIYGLKKNGFLCFLPHLQIKSSCLLLDASGELAGVEQTDGQGKLKGRVEIKGDSEVVVELDGKLGTQRLRLFDEVLVKVTAGDNPYRIPKPEVRLVLTAKLSVKRVSISIYPD
ncbi:hypothetical protein AAMO2058_000068700 [Amorphochlora amoebiformis]